MSTVRIMMIAAAALLLAGCGGGGGEGGSQAVENTWMSYEKGMELAGKTGRPVVIDFYTSWCRWCKVMDQKTFSDAEVASYLKSHFVSIRVNAEQNTGSLQYEGRSYTPAQLARALRLTRYPSVAYLDAGGKLLFVDKGFKEPGPFMTNLRYVTSGCHEKGVSLEEYRKRGGDCG
jgi:thioredoxin-related protein